MPRNQSEKLMSCPAAIAYADRIEKMLDPREDPDSMYNSSTRRHLYDAIPHVDRCRISSARHKRKCIETRANLAFNIKYIREHYGP